MSLLYIVSFQTLANKALKTPRGQWKRCHWWNSLIRHFWMRLRQGMGVPVKMSSKKLSTFSLRTNSFWPDCCKGGKVVEAEGVRALDTHNKLKDLTRRKRTRIASKCWSHNESSCSHFALVSDGTPSQESSWPVFITGESGRRQRPEISCSSMPPISLATAVTC